MGRRSDSIGNSLGVLAQGPVGEVMHFNLSGKPGQAPKLTWRGRLSWRVVIAVRPSVCPWPVPLSRGHGHRPSILRMFDPLCITSNRRSVGTVARKRLRILLLQLRPN